MNIAVYLWLLKGKAKTWSVLCKNRSQPISGGAEHSGHVLFAFMWSSVTVSLILSLRLSSLGWSSGSKFLQQPAAISTESLLCFPPFETGINTLTVLLLNKCFQEMFECGLRGITTSPCYLQTKMMSALKAPFLLPLVRMNALSWGFHFDTTWGKLLIVSSVPGVPGGSEHGYIHTNCLGTCTLLWQLSPPSLMPSLYHGFGKNWLFLVPINEINWH